MSGEHNPYDSIPAVCDQPRTKRQRMVACLVGAVVTLSAALTLLAFAFGLLISVAGRSMPSPLRFSAVLSSPLGQRFLMGTVVILPAKFYWESLPRLASRGCSELCRRQHDVDRNCSSNLKICGRHTLRSECSRTQTGMQNRLYRERKK